MTKNKYTKEEAIELVVHAEEIAKLYEKLKTSNSQTSLSEVVEFYHSYKTKGLDMVIDVESIIEEYIFKHADNKKIMLDDFVTYYCKEKEEIYSNILKDKQLLDQKIKKPSTLGRYAVDIGNSINKTGENIKYLCTKMVEYTVIGSFPEKYRKKLCEKNNISEEDTMSISEIAEFSLGAGLLIGGAIGFSPMALIAGAYLGIESIVRLLSEQDSGGKIPSAIPTLGTKILELFYNPLKEPKKEEKELPLMIEENKTENNKRINFLTGIFLLPAETQQNNIQQSNNSNLEDDGIIEFLSDVVNSNQAINNSNSNNLNTTEKILYKQKNKIVFKQLPNCAQTLYLLDEPLEDKKTLQNRMISSCFPNNEIITPNMQLVYQMMRRGYLLRDAVAMKDGKVQYDYHQEVSELVKLMGAKNDYYLDTLKYYCGTSIDYKKKNDFIAIIKHLQPDKSIIDIQVKVPSLTINPVNDYWSYFTLAKEQKPSELGIIQKIPAGLDVFLAALLGDGYEQAGAVLQYYATKNDKGNLREIKLEVPTILNIFDEERAAVFEYGGINTGRNAKEEKQALGITLFG